MSSSDKDCCKLCGAKTLPLFAYPRDIPEVIPFRVYDGQEWKGASVRLCPKCGYIQGVVYDQA